MEKNKTNQSTVIEGLISIEESILNNENKWNTITYSWYTLKKRYNLDTVFTVDIESNFPFKYTAHGLYYQEAPYQQALFVHCVSGAASIIIIDLRPESSTFCAYNQIILDANDNDFHAVYIPKGCTYGFVTLEDNTTLRFKSDNYFKREFERKVNFLDPYFNICIPYPDKFSTPVSISELMAAKKIIISVEDKHAPWVHKVIQSSQPIINQEGCEREY